ncbi:MULTISPECIES: serine/threonine-protein kinase [Streptomyces]|uniref:Serine/threonine-protein kinase n=2 Tax=Streptomyces caniscabiei TaxID=2746961 RepID=A0ABU4MPW3_9ACTN|nr:MULTISPECIES: serine/threonine-protein kinase [Streptomyces]MBE4737924.1 serine/threonine protein kinase [Streptomyces caniscabiei]MBE4757277.1 serine/threonine protein kinase [Streptomyces caniscabiei]MBE4769276.1 serine/threonine protein kinase [Streptomyces caniscabiei]MBE4785003.1 serine/threonine protein kinase [Streptomyces caniscabiei]MBE4795787.1 serine/threonine protein kinase [Streptomyces caniscabiei]
MGEVRAGGQFRPLEAGDPTTVASYRLAARLGSGGMGTVYLSYTPGGHPIALKTIRPELSEDPEFRRRFKQEVRAAQRVQGLYTAPVLDHDTEGAQPWLATAYVPGPSLHAAVAEHGALPLNSVLLLLAGVAEALSVIHGAGIVHRDLKPSNVLLAADGPRVIDFGIARAADATALTGTGVSIGTPAFMSPEQAAGKPVTPASDVFALGQVAAFAARGSGAYGDGPSHAVLYRIVHEEPDLGGLSDELRFIERCLAKDPAERPSPAEVVALCQEASATPLVQSGSWLPEAIGADITRRVSASAELLAERNRAAGTATPATQTPPPTAPVTQLSPPSVDHGAQTMHAAPTMHSGPTTPPPPGPVGPPSAPYAPQPGPSGPHTVPTGHHAPYQQPGGWQQPYPPGHGHPQGPPRPLPVPPPRSNVGKWIGIGVAAVFGLGLLGSCASLVKGLTDSSSGSSSQSSGGSTGGASAGSGGDSASKPKADPKPVTFKGVNIPGNYYVRFADSPPKPIDSEMGVSYEDDGDFYYYSDPLFEEKKVGSSSDKLVLLNNSQKGSLATCRGETRYTDSVKLGQVSKGSQMCVRTNSGHMALVTFQGSAPSGDPSDYVSVDITVWRNAEEPTTEN